MKVNNSFHYMYRVIAFALPISAGGVVNMAVVSCMMMVALLGKEH